MPITGFPPATALLGDSTLAGSWMLNVTQRRKLIPRVNPKKMVDKMARGPGGRERGGGKGVQGLNRAGAGAAKLFNKSPNAKEWIKKMVDRMAKGPGWKGEKWGGGGGWRGLAGAGARTANDFSCSFRQPLQKSSWLTCAR